MSSISGLSQFSNRFAQNMMGYNEQKDKERERLADKARELARQAQADKNNQETHDLNQQAVKIDLENGQINLKQNQTKDKAFNNSVGYEDAMNKARSFTSTGQTSMAVKSILEGVNSNSNMTFAVDVERDENGIPIERTDEEGNKYYAQSVIDKETGLVLKTHNLSYDQIVGSYTQLQNGQSIAASEAEAARLRKEAIEKAEAEKAMYGFKADIDVKKNAVNKATDYEYDISKLGVQHGYSLDLANNNAYNTQQLAGINHGYRMEEGDQRTVNAINQAYGIAGINQGQAPNISGGASIDNLDRGTQVNIITQSLIGTESGGKSTAFRTNANGKSYGGLLQMGSGRLSDYAKATGSKPISATQFKNLSPVQQQSINQWHVNDLINAAKATGAVGKTINGVPVTLSGLVAVGHLGGKGGMQKFVSSNGRYNPKDELGTSLTDYLIKHRMGGGNAGVNVSFNQPIQPKAVKQGKTNTVLEPTNATPKAFNAQIDSGVDKAIKDAKSLGVKPNAATAASYARAGNILKSMSGVTSYDEFIAKYQEAADIIIDSIPEQRGKKSALSKADKNALAHKTLLSMAGATSLGNFKDIIYAINPNAQGSASSSGLTVPGKTGSRQVAKLAALQTKNSRGAGVKLPSLSDSAARLSNANDNIDWN